MKYLLPLLTTIFFFAGVTCIKAQRLIPPLENPREILKKNNIHNDSVFMILTKKAKPDSILYSYLEYDQYGNGVYEFLTGHKEFPSAEKEIFISYYLPEAIRKRQIVYKNLKMVENEEFEYDTLKNEITSYSYNRDTTKLTVDQKFYNSRNKITELQRKINNTDNYVYQKFYYDSNDRTIKIDAYDRQGKIIYSNLYEYAGNKKSFFSENEDGKKLVQENYMNAEGKILKTLIFGKGFNFSGNVNNMGGGFQEETIEKIYTYYPDGTLEKETITINGKILHIYYHRYH